MILKNLKNANKKRIQFKNFYFFKLVQTNTFVNFQLSKLKIKF